MSNMLDLSTLKIETLTSAMKYPPRDDFAARRQELIDSVRREVTTVLRAAAKPGRLEIEIDSDGDLIFEYEHSSFHFRLDSRSGLTGGQFKNLYDHSLALDVLRGFYTQVIRIFGLRDVDALTIDFKNVFNVNTSGSKNIGIFEEKLIPDLRNALAPLVSVGATIERADLKVGWDYDERRTCYLTVECPANDENTTVWTTLNLRTREDILVSVDKHEIDGDLDKAYDVYCGPYNGLVRRLLDGVEVDLWHRQLKRRGPC